MKKKRLLLLLLLIFILTIIISLSNLGTSIAQECRIIRIIGIETYRSVRIEPETISLSKGDCAVWFNRASAEEIKVIFEDAKKCQSVTNAPVGFSADSKGCYVANWIPFGGTTSLRFMEKGNYEYVMEVKGMRGVKIKGQIQVN